MRYNFKTEKGYITNVQTQQGEGYLTGGTTKKNDDGSFYLQNGRYSTCDDHECPHFWLQLTKAKVIPKKISSPDPPIWCWPDCRCRWRAVRLFPVYREVLLGVYSRHSAMTTTADSI